MVYKKRIKKNMSTRALAFLMTIIMVGTYLADGAKAVAEGLSETVTEEAASVDYSEYTAVHNREELRAIAQYPDRKYYLANDIDLAGEEWEPIGRYTDEYGYERTIAFYGVFDGRGHVIRNMTNHRAVSCALFDNVTACEGYDTVIRDLKIENVQFEMEDTEFSEYDLCKRAGLAVSLADMIFDWERDSRGLVIQDISVSGVIEGQVCGGICVYGPGGYESSDAMVFERCVNNADISGESVAGIAMRMTAKLKDCANHGKIVQHKYGDEYTGTVGGLVVFAEGSSFIDCINTGNIESYTGAVGGIASNVASRNGEAVSFINCENRGNIIIRKLPESRGCCIGGIVGGLTMGSEYSLNDYCRISNCTNNGDIIRDYSDNYYGTAGGIAGSFSGVIENCLNNGNMLLPGMECGGIASDFTGKAENCQNTGEINGRRTGGIVAYGYSFNGDYVTLKSCVNTGNLQGSSSSGGIIAYASVNMITDCRNEGEVSGGGGSGNAVGGIAGTVYFWNVEEGTAAIARCENLGKVSINYSDVETCAGGIAGIIGTGATVEECINTGEIVNGAGIIGIVGRAVGTADKESVIRNCINTGNTSGEQSAGILYYGSKTTLTDCVNEGNVSAYGSTGGIAGRAYKIKDCVNSGNISRVSKDDEQPGDIRDDYVGGILGMGETVWLEQEERYYVTKITDCTNSGVISGGTKTGGIAGGIANAYSCSNSGAVAGGPYTGGIIGDPTEHSHSYEINISECSNSGSVTGTLCVGGIAGHIDESLQLFSCANSGDVSVVTSGDDAGTAGGIIGRIDGYEEDTQCVKDCYNCGNVSTALVGDSESGYPPSITAGGIVGSISHLCDTEIKNSYSLGKISAGPGFSGKIYAGGIVGRSEIQQFSGDPEPKINTAVVSCVTLCSSIDADWQNGIFGDEYNFSSANAIVNGGITDDCKDNLWRSDGITQHDGLIGSEVYAENFYQQSAYTEMGWDFENVWEIATGGGLPVLRWQGLAEGPRMEEIAEGGSCSYVAMGKSGDISWGVYRQVNGGGASGYKLIISGDGNIPDYEEGEQPWKDYNDRITRVEFCSDKIRKIGKYAFSDMSKLIYIFLPASVNEIGEGAFKNDVLIGDLSLKDGIKIIGADAFSGCTGLTILCNRGSTAHIYAEANNIPFVLAGTPSGVDIEYDRIYELPVHFQRFDSNENPFYIKWKMGDLLDNSVMYHHRLAIAGLVLSAAANNTQARAEDTFYRLGFDREKMESFFYGGDWELSKPSMTCASRKITVKGKDKYIIGVVIRGTRDAGDILTDIGAVNHGFSVAAENTGTKLREYMESKWHGACTKDNTYFFICGHSYGAATASVMAEGLGDIAYADHINAYVYAPPGYNTIQGNTNYIKTFINADDSVPNMVPTKGHVGNIIRYNREGESLNFELAYKVLSGSDKGYDELMDVREFLASLPAAHLGENLFLFAGNTKAALAHSVEVYMAFLMNHGRAGAISRRYSKIVRVECPVDVTVFDSEGNYAGSVSGNTVSYPEYTDIIIITDGDKKYIMMPYGSEYELQLTGTDSGTMTYTTEIYDVGHDETVSKKVFSNVALSAGKKMESSTTEEDITSDVRLYILNDKGEREKEIGTDGTEGEIGQVVSEMETTEPEKDPEKDPEQQEKDPEQNPDTNPDNKPEPDPDKKQEDDQQYEVVPAGIFLAVKQKRDISKDFSNGGYKKYTVDQKKLASVNSKGILTAKKPGKVIVTGLIKADKKWIPDTANAIEITIEAPKFTQNRVDATRSGIVIDGAALLKGSLIKPSGWKSSKPKVASVDTSTGQITTQAKGTTTITAFFGEGKMAAKISFKLKVVIPAISKTGLSLQTGQTVKLKLKNTKLVPVWNSTDEAYAKVAGNGEVSALSATAGLNGESLTKTGESFVCISAVVEGVPYTCEVTVKPPKIKTPALLVAAGNTAKVELKNTKLKAIKWISSDETLATVDGNGLVSVNGNASSGRKVTIYTETGGVRNECLLTVK